MGEFSIDANTDMTRGDWNTILPYMDKIQMVTVTGSTLFKVSSR